MPTKTCLIIALAIPSTAFAAPDLQKLTHDFDQLYRSSASESKLKMVVKKPEYTRDMEMGMWTQGLTRTLVRITSPKKEEGTASLKRDAEMWNYLPKLKKTIRVPSSMMMQSWMGSHFNNDELMHESSWENQYTRAASPSSPANQTCIDYTPKPDAAVTWKMVTICFDTASGLPVTQTYVDEKDHKARVLTYGEIAEMGGRKLPTLIKLVPLDASGKPLEEFTSLKYESLKFSPQGDDLFSMTSLNRER